MSHLIRKSILGLMTGVWLLSWLTGCVNPVAETYQKGVEGGQRAIDKAKGVQQQLNTSNQKLQQQQNQIQSPGQ